MFAFLSSGTELSRFKRGKLPKIAVAVMLFIPLIYGALYLWAFQAPDKHHPEGLLRQRSVRGHGLPRTNPA